MAERLGFAIPVEGDEYGFPFYTAGPSLAT